MKPIFILQPSLHHGWFRVFGYGLAWKDTRIVVPLAKERHGLKRYYRIGPWSFRVLCGWSSI